MELLIIIIMDCADARIGSIMKKLNDIRIGILKIPVTRIIDVYKRQAYEGGGYSESRENQARDREEHRLITEKYMKKSELARYRAMMALTLAPLRRKMAESRALSGLYHSMKDKLYGRKGR